jgi:uncharacterized protein (DUF2141 family)
MILCTLVRRYCGAALAAVLLCAAGATAAPDTLVVKVCGLTKAGGVVDLTVYRNDSYYLSDDSCVVCKRVACAAGAVCPAVFVPLALAPGEYAFTVYHDVNSNGKVDVNLVGYPTEPLAFSRPFRLTFRAPRFNEISFWVNKPRDTIDVMLPK